MTITKAITYKKPPPPPGAPNITQRIQAMQLAERYHTSAKQEKDQYGQIAQRPKKGGIKLVLPPKSPPPPPPTTAPSVNTKSKIPTVISIPVNFNDDKQGNEAEGRRILRERNVRFANVRFVRRSKTKGRNDD